MEKRMEKRMEIERMAAERREGCTGCWSCFNACRAGAIGMEEDGEGFRYPRVDAAKCLHCGACERACPALQPPTAEREGAPQAYAAMALDEDIRAKSSSGGIFHLLAEQVLSAGGIVFGAGFDERFEVVHQGVERPEELKRLHGSKYLQSRIEGGYLHVLRELGKGRRVLFSGTPCQCAALRQFLGKPYPNLFLVDFICHGVPSPKVWRKYVTYRAAGRLIREISFRDKNLSWERYLLSFSFGKEKDSKYLAEDVNHDLYMRGFLQNLCLRPSCHACRFCRASRLTDVTLADYWGVQQDLPEMYDGRGTSLVILHSEKGRNAFEKLPARKMAADFSRAISHNPAMVRPAVPSRQREAFFRALAEDREGIDALLRRYTKIPLKQRVWRGIRERLWRVPGIRWLKKVLGQRREPGAGT